MRDIVNRLATCLHVVQNYEWLLDSYVLDFYVHDHWSKLPLSWKKHFEHLSVEKLAMLLQSDSNVSDAERVIWPLELLALRQVLHTVCVSRNPVEKSEVTLMPFPPLLDHKKLKHMFTKCVKPKKVHEIRKMAAICARSCQQASVDLVVDFGAGVGHLARMLGYGYGIQVCCFEMQSELNAQALGIDAKLENMAAKHLTASEVAHFRRPTHLTQRLTSTTNSAQFIECIREAFRLPGNEFQFGIIGLHPCGDLGAILLRMFLNCKQAKFLNFVGCCYHKMSTLETQPDMKIHGYPLSSLMSRQLKDIENSSKLSHETREIACHAIELYHDRLNSGQYEYLKIHSLRAAAERIIVKNLPNLRHSALRNVKHTPGMSFKDYFEKAVDGTPFEKLNPSQMSQQTESDLKQWRHIVCFYTIRLMLAPCVESIILYDRAIFLMENGCEVNIEPIFNPRISPRNHITCAVKN